MAEIKTVLPKPRIRIDEFGDITPITGNSRFVTGDFYDAEQMREAIEAAVLSANAGKVDEDVRAYKFIEYGMTPEDWDEFKLWMNEKHCPDPTQQAIDAPTAAERRYEIVRKMNVHQFTTLFKLNIDGEGRFDDLVDQLGQQAIDARNSTDDEDHRDDNYMHDSDMGAR